MSTECLRPQAEGALRWAAASRVQRDKRVKQEWHVVAARVDIALVHIYHVGQSVQIFDRGTVCIVNDLTVRAAIRDPENLAQWLAIGEFHCGVVELATYHEVDGCAFCEGPLRQGSDMRTYEGDLQLWIGSFHRCGKPDVALEARRTGKQHQEVEILANFYGFFRAHMMRRSVEHARAFQHARRVSQPDRIPIRLNLAGSWPTRTGAAVVVLERRRIQKQCLQRHISESYRTICCALAETL